MPQLIAHCECRRTLSIASCPLIVSNCNETCLGMFVTHCVIGVNWVVPMGYSLVDGRCTGRLPETKFESVFAGDWFQLLIRQDSAKALELSLSLIHI